MSYTPENETAIAYWTRPQYITINGKMNIGVAAHALEGIEKVEFYLQDADKIPTQLSGDFNLDGKVNVDDLNYILSNWGTVGPADLVKVLGNWGAEEEDSGDLLGVATEERRNDETGELEWFFEFNSVGYEDLKRLRICAKVYPKVGIPLKLEGSFLDYRSICGLDVFPDNVEYIQDPALYVSGTGSDETGDGSKDNPFATIHWAAYHNLGPLDTNAGRVIKLLEGEHKLASNNEDRAMRRVNSSGKEDGQWVTIESAVDPELCPIVGQHNGVWSCKLYFKNVNIVPKTVEDGSEMFISSRSMYCFHNCLIEGKSRENAAIPSSETDKFTTTAMTKSGSHIFSIGSTWKRHFQPAMRIVDIQSHYDLIVGDIMLTGSSNLVSGVSTSRHGFYNDDDGTPPPESGVHVDFIQTHPGGRYDEVIIHENIIIRYCTEWTRNGGQQLFGSFGRNDLEESEFRNFAFVGNRLAQWAGIDDDNYPGVKDETGHMLVGRARMFAWGVHNTRNCLFQDNTLFGKGNWFGAEQEGNQVYPYDNGYGSPRYTNVMWRDNYRTPDKEEYFMPTPDATSGNGLGTPDELRFDPETMTLPWTSPATGVHYEGNASKLASHKWGTYLNNDDLLEKWEE
jgi:hypothetical protein